MAPRFAAYTKAEGYVSVLRPRCTSTGEMTKAKLQEAYQGLEMDMSEPLRVDVVFDFVAPGATSGSAAWKPRSKCGEWSIPAIPSQWCAGCLSS